MTTEATIARKVAMACEAKKHAYRQTQDGVVVSFVLHPQEVPEGLAIAPLGQRYQLAMVALNDDDTPREEVVQHGANPRNNAQPASVPEPVRAPQHWDNMTPAAQSGMLCHEMSFQKFIKELGYPCSGNESARSFVIKHCRVKSRADIVRGDKSNDYWMDLVAKYRAWMREPSVVLA